MARAVSAMVSADVTLRPFVRTDLRAAASFSSNAATSALDSMYRTPAMSTAEAGALALRFATVGVNQRCGGSRRKADVRPPFGRVTSFEWWANHSGGHKLVEPARRILRLCAWRNELGDDPSMSGDRDTLAGLDAPDVTAQVVFEVADAGGGHVRIIATYGHIRQAPAFRCASPDMLPPHFLARAMRRGCSRARARRLRGRWSASSMDSMNARA